MSTRSADDDSSEFSKLAWITAVICCAAIKSDTVRKVIVHLGMTADRTGARAYRPTSTLMSELDVSRETIKRARADAVRHGFMVVTRPGRAGAGGNKSAEYRLLLPIVGDPNRVQPDPIRITNRVQPDPIPPSNRVWPDPPGGSHQTQLPARIGSGESPPLGTASLGSSLGEPRMSLRAVAPSRFCRRHNGNHNPPCAGCRDARKALEAWEAARAAAESAAVVERRAIAENCRTCQGTHWIPDTDPAVRCRHETQESA